MKKTRLALAAPVLAVALAACGGSGTTAATSPASTSTTTSSSAAATTSSSAASTTSTDAPTSSTTSETSTGTSTETATGTVATPTSTATSAGWVTTEHRLRPKTSAGTVADGWTTTTGNADEFCQMPGGKDMSASSYAKGSGVFTCGPTAASLLACWTFVGGKVGCMRDASRELVMFRSTLRWTGAAAANPTPIKVVLADGTVCTPMAHDQAEHYQGRSGFLGCGKDFELLTAQHGTYGYFDTSAPQWTADSVPYAGVVAPKAVQVKEIWFAQGA